MAQCGEHVVADGIGIGTGRVGPPDARLREIVKVDVVDPSRGGAHEGNGCSREEGCVNRGDAPNKQRVCLGEILARNRVTIVPRNGDAVR